MPCSAFLLRGCRLGRRRLRLHCRRLRRSGRRGWFSRCRRGSRGRFSRCRSRRCRSGRCGSRSGLACCRRFSRRRLGSGAAEHVIRNDGKNDHDQCDQPSTTAAARRGWIDTGIGRSRCRIQRIGGGDVGHVQSSLDEKGINQQRSTHEARSGFNLGTENA
ncbi:hypothetical protein J2X35_002629 [Mesorhizobium sp. BE184]|nr:hypothetical protein [Mesorhizobium sp. BE184]